MNAGFHAGPHAGKLYWYKVKIGHGIYTMSCDTQKRQEYRYMIHKAYSIRERSNVVTGDSRLKINADGEVIDLISAGSEL